MLITPKTDEQIEQERSQQTSKYQPWPAGTVVDYQIKEATDAVSKNGNDMIKAHIDVYNDKGEVKPITVYFGSWNDYHFSRINRERYEAGQVDAQDLFGKTGKCVLGIEKGSQKDDGTFYADKNNIKEFLKPVESVKPSTKKIDDELSDSIPF